MIETARQSQETSQAASPVACAVLTERPHSADEARPGQGSGGSHERCQSCLLDLEESGGLSEATGEVGETILGKFAACWPRWASVKVVPG